MQEPLSQARIEADIFELVGIYYQFLNKLRRFGENDVVGIYGQMKRFEYLFSKETYEFIMELINNGQNLNSTTIFRIRVLRKFIIDNRALFHNFAIYFSVLAGLQTKKVKVDSSKIYLSEAYRKILKSSSSETRTRYAVIYMQNVAKINRKFAKIYQESLDFALNSGFTSALPFLAQDSLQDYKILYENAIIYLNETSKQFIGAGSRFARDNFGISLTELHIADFWFLFYGDGNKFQSFSQKSGFDAIVLIADKMGLEFKKSPRAAFDIDYSPKKTARAFCALDALSEDNKVMAVCNPSSTENPIQLSTLFHEIGHMIHYLNMDENLEMFDQYIGEIDVSEVIANLFAKLLYNPAFIAQFWDLSDEEMGVYTQLYKFFDFFSQRYTVFLYIIFFEILTSPTTQNLNDKHSQTIFQSLFEEKFVKWFGFHRSGFDLFKPRDKIFESSVYLRAIIGSSQITHYLQQNFVVNWWNSKKAGHYLLKNFLLPGYSIDFNRMMKSQNFNPHSFEYLPRFSLIDE